MKSAKQIFLKGHVHVRQLDELLEKKHQNTSHRNCCPFTCFQSDWLQAMAYETCMVEAKVVGLGFSWRKILALSPGFSSSVLWMGVLYRWSIQSRLPRFGSGLSGGHNADDIWTPTRHMAELSPERDAQAHCPLGQQKSRLQVVEGCQH